MIDACFAKLQPLVGTAGACRASGKSRATHYRRCRPSTLGPRQPRGTPSNALSDVETTELLALLRSPRFVDLAPAQVWAIVLDEGCYVASISTMYRVLRANDEVRERRAQAKHPTRARPELMADKPNMCWTWDITKLRGPDKGVWLDCYVAIDIFSRYVVGWMVATTETAELAQGFITRAVDLQGITKGSLTIHADRGTSMTSKGVAELLTDLGVARTHSRPHVSNDNPYSEAVNKTLKYCPAFPATVRFDRRCTGVLCRILRVLQPSPSSFRDRIAHPRVSPLRHSRRDPRSSNRGPARGLRRKPLPVREPQAPPAPATHRSMDQQADHRQRRTEVIVSTCLKDLDRLRAVGPIGDGHGQVGEYNARIVGVPVDPTRRHGR